MSGTVGGKQERPRVALVGCGEDDVAELSKLFPTVHVAACEEDLLGKVHLSELDLVVLGPYFMEDGSALTSLHVICFGVSHGPEAAQFHIRFGARSRRLQLADSMTAEFGIPEVDPRLARVRAQELSKFGSARDAEIIVFNRDRRPSAVDSESFKLATTWLMDGAILTSNVPKGAIGVSGKHPESGKQFVWLPDFTLIVDWVKAFVGIFEDLDPRSFPNATNWKDHATWQTQEERDAAASLLELAGEQAAALAEFEAQEAALAATLEEAKARADAGSRGVLTEQGDGLVRRVAEVLREFGLLVTDVDAAIPEGAPRREDLEIRLPGDNEWTGIAEVRGYSRGGAKTGDLLRLQHFRKLFRERTDRLPDKVLYICNGQFTVPPTSRARPLAGDPDSAAVFGEDDGLIIDTRDLFRMHQDLDQHGPEFMRNLIRDTVGVLEYPGATAEDEDAETGDG